MPVLTNDIARLLEGGFLTFEVESKGILLLSTSLTWG